MTKQAGNNSAVVSRGRFMLFSIALMIAAIIPASMIDFPAGDSWTHGWTVKEWLQGRFILNDWSSAVALPQQILGWLVHLGAGTVHWPRLSVLTMVATIGGCLIAARLPGKLYPEFAKSTDWPILFAVLIIAQTFTLKVAAGFMTDGYYLLFLSASLWILLSLLNQPEKQSGSTWARRWIAFAALATLASLQRSHGVTLLFIAGLWVLIAKVLFPSRENRDDANHLKAWSGWRGWLPAALCAAGIIFAFIVLSLPTLHPARSDEVTQEIKDFWLGDKMPYREVALDRLWLVFGVIQHIGFALLPVTLVARMTATSGEKKSGGKRVNWWYIIFGAALLLFTLARWANGEQWQMSALFPYVGNSITEEGFGPRAMTIALSAAHELDRGLRFVLTILGTVGGVILIWLLSRSVRILNVDWRAPSTLVGFIGLAHLALVFLNMYFFDRYLLPLLPFALCWLAPFLKDAQARSRIVAWILLVIYLAFSIWGTVDATSWTRAKWDLAVKAQARGIPASQIITGYEPDGYFNYTNETYPGLVPRSHPLLPWWVTRLGLQIQPAFVVFEKGAEVAGTPWEGYVRSDLQNDKMQAWAHPDVVGER